MEEQPSAGLDLSGVGALLGGAPLPSSCTLHCVRACAVAAANLTTTTTVDITTIVHLKAPECHPCVGGGEVFDDHLHHLLLLAPNCTTGDQDGLATMWGEVWQLWQLWQLCISVIERWSGCCWGLPSCQLLMLVRPWLPI